MASERFLRHFGLQLRARLFPEVVLREVVRIEVVHIFNDLLVYAQVMEYLSPSAKVNLNAVEHILDQVRQSLARILLLVQILHAPTTI